MNFLKEITEEYVLCYFSHDIIISGQEEERTLCGRHREDHQRNQR